VRKKITKCEKFFNTVDVFVYVILSAEKDRQTTEIILRSEKISFRLKEESTNLYASIDFVSDRFEKQLRKQKDISKKVHRKDKFAIFKKRNTEEVFSYDTNRYRRRFKNKNFRNKYFDLQPVMIKKTINKMTNLNY
jgi:putative sigma-54 modulation protein